MRLDLYEVQIFFDSVSFSFVASTKTKVPGRIHSQSALNMEEAFTLESDGAEIVENVYRRGWIVIEVVTDSGGKLGNRATCRSRPAVGRAADVKVCRDHSHVDHWSDSDLVVTPTIGIHRSKGAKPQIRSGAQVCLKGFAAEREGTTECSLSVPGCLTVTSLELVLSARGSVSKTQLKTEFVLKVEIV